MIIVKNNIIPLKRFNAMTICPFIFVRKDREQYFTKEVERHEGGHGEQQAEMTLLGFLIAILLSALGCELWSLLAVPLFLYWYCLEWLVKLAITRDALRANESQSMERDALDCELSEEYYLKRKPFAWVKYITYIKEK